LASLRCSGRGGEERRKCAIEHSTSSIYLFSVIFVVYSLSLSCLLQAPLHQLPKAESFLGNTFRVSGLGPCPSGTSLFPQRGWRRKRDKIRRRSIVHWWEGGVLRTHTTIFRLMGAAIFILCVAAVVRPPALSSAVWFFLPASRTSFVPLLLFQPLSRLSRVCIVRRAHFGARGYLL
jgi:hypothetical protein